MKNWLEHPVFVIGYPKSGTTLLVGMLDGHNELMVFPEETRVMSSVYPFFSAKLEANNKPEVSLLWDMIMERSNVKNLRKGTVKESNQGNFDYSDFDFPLFKEKALIYLKGGGISIPNIFKSLNLAFVETQKQKKETIKYWVEKTPRHYESVAQLAEMYPNSKFIHIVRDPRDNWVSYKKKKGSDFQLLNFCYHWRNAYRIAQSNMKKWGTDKYLLFKYESLVENPETAINRLVQFLDIDKSEGLKIPTRNNKPWHGNSMWGDKNSSISTSAIGRYKKWENKDEIKFIESALGRDIEGLGQELIKTNGLLPKLKLAFFSFKKGWRNK